MNCGRVTAKTDVRTRRVKHACRQKSNVSRRIDEGRWWNDDYCFLLFFLSFSHVITWLASFYTCTSQSNETFSLYRNVSYSGINEKKWECKNCFVGSVYWSVFPTLTRIHSIGSINYHVDVSTVAGARLYNRNYKRGWSLRLSESESWEREGETKLEGTSESESVSNSMEESRRDRRLILKFITPSLVRLKRLVIATSVHVYGSGKYTQHRPGL